MRRALVTIGIALALALGCDGDNRRAQALDAGVADACTQGPAVVVRPPAIDFGRVASGTVAIRTVSVQSNRCRPIELMSYRIAERDDFDVRLAEPTEPAVLGAHESVEIEITHAPVIDAPTTTTLRIRVDDEVGETTEIPWWRILACRASPSPPTSSLSTTLGRWPQPAPGRFGSATAAMPS